jgi:hypothetical protein
LTEAASSAWLPVKPELVRTTKPHVVSPHRASKNDGGLLLPGQIDERSTFARELVVLYIADDSDYLSPPGLVGAVSFVTQL